MCKERVERYRSASELADDIENYLKGVPLIAGPPSTVYRLKKFVRRNWALVTGIATVLAVLLGGVVVSTLFAIGQARARAETQLIADFLEKDVLGMASRAKIGEATVSYLLDAASKRLDEGTFEEKPLIEASIRETLAVTYRQIGEPNKAEQYFLRAIEIYQQHHGEEHPDTLQATGSIGWVYEDQGRYHDMERLWTKNLQVRQRVSGVEQQVGTMNALAVTFYYLGRYKEAESLFEKALQLIRSELRGEDVWLLPWFGCNLARVYTAQGRYEEAEQLFVETFKTTEWPEEHISAKFMYTSFLADTYREQGRYTDAERLFTQAVEALRLLRGTKHVRTLRSTLGLDRLYIEQGRFSQAEDLLSDALETAQAQLRKEHPITLSFMNSLAVLRTKQKQYDQAETLFDEALKGRQRELGEDHPDTLESKNDLAVLYKEQERYEEAQELLLKAIEGRRLKLGDTHPHTLESWHNLIELYEAWGKTEEAEKWRAKLPQPADAEAQG
jgi:tetratricopeptide (TPR) repeat protein